jgi:hypothetical protein
MLVYLVWAAISFTIVLYLRFDRIDERGYLIIYQYALRLDGASARFIRCLGHKHTKEMYILLNLLISSVLLVSGTLSSWDRFQTSTIGLQLMMLCYNGA